MTDSSGWMREPSSSMKEAPPKQPTAPMVVFGSAGGVGASVVSALVASYWADQSASGQVSTAWVDGAPGDGDMMDRLGAEGEDSWQQPDRLGLWRPDGYPDDLVEVVGDAGAGGVVPFIDAGARAVRSLNEVQALVAGGAVPVLVIGLRPDLLNRSRSILSLWADGGVLASTIVVLNTTVPGIADNILDHTTSDLFARSARDCIGLDYDPVLGLGGSLRAEDRGRLHTETQKSIEAIAIAGMPRRLAVAQ